jgi:hypothetical protein
VFLHDVVHGRNTVGRDAYFVAERDELSVVLRPHSVFSIGGGARKFGVVKCFEFASTAYVLRHEQQQLSFGQRLGQLFSGFWPGDFVQEKGDELQRQIQPMVLFVLFQFFAGGRNFAPGRRLQLSLKTLGRRGVEEARGTQWACVHVSAI